MEYKDKQDKIPALEYFREGHMHQKRGKKNQCNRENIMLKLNRVLEQIQEFAGKEEPFSVACERIGESR